MKKLVLFFIMIAFMNNMASANEFGIFIYENPANEKVLFDVVTPEAADISVLIYDNMGNVMFSQKSSTMISSKGNSLKISWNLTNKTGKRISAGTYTIQATAKSANGNEIYQYFSQLGIRK